MEQIKNNIEKAISTLTNISEKQQRNTLQKNKPRLDWLPVQFEEQYRETDLDYLFCLRLFGQLEAAKRDNIPEVTMRQWFLEFIRLGWTKSMVEKQYRALIKTPKYGAIDFSEWITSTEVFTRDETNLKVVQQISSMIQRGNFLKDKKVELNDEDKRCIDLWAAQDAELKYKREKAEAIEDRRNERREIFYRRLTGG